MHLRTCVPQKSKYIYIFILFISLFDLFIYLFIYRFFWRKATFTHARVFSCIAAILRKENFVNIVRFLLIWVQKLVITTTVTKWNSKKKSIEIQRLDLLNPWSHFLPFLRGPLKNLTRIDGSVKRSHFGSELMSSCSRCSVQLTFEW